MARPYNTFGGFDHVWSEEEKGKCLDFVEHKCQKFFLSLDGSCRPGMYDAIISEEVAGLSPEAVAQISHAPPHHKSVKKSY